MPVAGVIILIAAIWAVPDPADKQPRPDHPEAVTTAILRDARVLTSPETTGPRTRPIAAPAPSQSTLGPPRPQVAAGPRSVLAYPHTRDGPTVAAVPACSVNAATGTCGAAVPPLPDEQLPVEPGWPTLLLPGDLEDTDPAASPALSTVDRPRPTTTRVIVTPLPRQLENGCDRALVNLSVDGPGHPP